MLNLKSSIPLSLLRLSRQTIALLSITPIAMQAIAQGETADPLAQLPSYDDWYQVEMIVFERSNTKQASSPEAWPKNISLTYPSKFQRLQSKEDERQALLKQLNATAETANLQSGAMGTSLYSTSSPTLGGISEHTTITERVAGGTSTETGSIEATDAEITNLEIPKYQPFRLLEQDDYIITNAASALKRERGVNVLFHESWLQPMTSLEDSPALIIRGGDSFGEHRELEGTVTLSLSRYLHIHTNLWLTQFEANYGQESKHWPELPPLPVSHSELVSAMHNSAALSGPANSTATATEPGLSLNLQTDKPLFETPELSSGIQLDDFSNITDKPFMVREIVTLMQKRRMRSGELHYIDHPRMGLLIKIVPFSPEIEEENAEQAVTPTETP